MKQNESNNRGAGNDNSAHVTHNTTAQVEKKGARKPSNPKPQISQLIRKWIATQWANINDWELSNKIGCASVIVNVVLLWFTYLLWDVAYVTLRNSNEQFRLVNKATLQCTGFYISSFEIGKQLKFNFQVSNYGNYPARIDSINILSHYYNNLPTDTLFNMLQNSAKTKEGFLVNKENPFIVNLATNKTITQDIYNATANGYLPVIWGEIIYTDELTKEKRKMLFAAAVSLPPSQGYKLFHNRTIEVNEENK